MSGMGTYIMIQNLPNKGDKMFLIHKEVVVINAYPIFSLIKIRYKEETFEFFVDANSLSTIPDFTNSISIRNFRGVCHE
jgi:hypothetical protein